MIKLELKGDMWNGKNREKSLETLMEAIEDIVFLSLFLFTVSYAMELIYNWNISRVVYGITLLMTMMLLIPPMMSYNKYTKETMVYIEKMKNGEGNGAIQEKRG